MTTRGRWGSRGWLLDRAFRWRPPLASDPSVMKATVVMPLGTQRGGAEVLLRELVGRSVGPQLHWQLIFLEAGPLVQEFRRLGASTSVIPSGRLRNPRSYWSCVLRIAK